MHTRSVSATLGTNTKFRVVPLLRSSQDIKRFARVSYGIYDQDSHWVAPLLNDFEETLSDRNPFFAHAQMSLWIVSQNDRDVGRIAGIIDHHYHQYQESDTAFFGFFEAIEDQQVAHVLMEAVVDWARAQGMRRLLGPMNPSANSECGLLVSGYNRSPVLMMAYNPSYYPPLVEGEGFTKAKDLFAYYIDLAQCRLDRVERAADRFQERSSDLQLRPLRRRSLAQDLPKIKEIYNEAWSKNWGFNPLTDAEVDFLAARLKPLLPEGLAWIAENEVEPVGLLLALPDFNEALKPLRGRLLSPGLFRALPYLLHQRQPAMVRVIALGVKERFRGRGIEAAMLTEAMKASAHLGFEAAEASWVLEDNIRSRRTIEIFGGQPYKTYRLYERGL